MGKITKLEALAMLEAGDFNGGHYGYQDQECRLHLCPSGMVASQRGAIFSRGTSGLQPADDESTRICHEALQDVAQFMVEQRVYEMNGNSPGYTFNEYTPTKVKAAILRWRAMMVENAREKEEVGV